MNKKSIQSIHYFTRFIAKRGGKINKRFQGREADLKTFLEYDLTNKQYNRLYKLRIQGKA